ncbi:MAG: hypothetical protein WCO54_07075 [Bacteroidota bacterium]
MKKLLVLATAIAFGFVTFAQDAPKKEAKKEVKTEKKEEKKEAKAEKKEAKKEHHEKKAAAPAEKK